MIRPDTLCLSLALFVCACTVTPRIVQDRTPSFDGSVQNSGFLGFYTNTQGQVFAVLTPRAKLRYDELAKSYGTRYAPPVHVGDGLVTFTNGTWLLDLEHDVKAREMNGWRRGE